MGFEARRNGRSYYYRKKRFGNKVVSQYVGAGEDGVLIAQMETLNRGEADYKRYCERHVIAEMKAEDAKADALGAEVEKLSAAVLNAAGFHCHKGSWRKKRMPTHKTTPQTAQRQLKPAPNKKSKGEVGLRKRNDSKVSAKHVAIIKAANQENATQEAVHAFRKLIEEKPGGFAELGNRLKLEITLLAGSFSKLPTETEPILLHIQRIREGLTTELDGPLESGLIDNVIMCWLRLAMAEGQFSLVMRTGMDLALAQYWEKRLTATQKRYLKACEMLARVRKLLRPAVPKTRLNVGVVNAVVTDSPLKELLRG
jgi:hypothetical protein